MARTAKQQAGLELGRSLDHANDILRKSGQQLDPGRVSSDQLSVQQVRNTVNSTPQVTLTAQDLENPAPEVTLPDEQIGQTASEFVSPIIRANTVEAEQASALRDQLGQSQPSLAGQFQTELDNRGVRQKEDELTRIQTQLAGLNTEFDLQGSRIEEGNSLNQLSREVSQNERERAIRTAGLAAKAQVLQGDIENARATAKDMVNFAFQDRQLANQNMRAQLDSLEGVVSGQEAQLLEQRRRELDAEEAELEDVKTNVADAISTGAATQDEVATLTSSTVSDEEKNALAQQISARAATELRDLEIERQNANINKLRASGKATGSATTDAVVAAGVQGTSEDPMYSIMANSAGGRLLTQSEAEPLTNSKRVADGLSDLQNAIAGADTDPILGTFKRINPYDLKAAEIDAAITQLVPQLARGTYGEVGVLTDADVARYADTLPNLTSTEQQNAAVMALTLRKVRSGFMSQIESMAAAGRDVSGFADIYGKFNDQITELEATIGVADPNTVDTDAEYDELFGDVQLSERGENAKGFFKSVGDFLFGSDR